MTLQEVLTALEAQENGAELVAAIKSELAAKNNEAAKYRTQLRTEQAEKGNIGTRLTAILDRLGIDATAEDFDAALDAALQPQAGGKGKADSETDARIATFERQLKTLQATLKQKDDAVVAERDKRHELLKRTAILSALHAHKAVRPDDLVNLYKPLAKVGDDEVVTLSLDDGTETDVQTGIGTLLPAEFRVNSSAAGAGSTGTGAAAGITQISKAELTHKRFKELEKDIDAGKVEIT